MPRLRPYGGRVAAVLSLVLALLVAGCYDDDPTGPVVERFESPQFVTVGEFNDFTRLTLTNAPALTPNFGNQLQGLWALDANNIFLSRGDDYWFEVDVTSNQANVVSSLQDLSTVFSQIQFGGWAASANDFWGGHEDGKLFRFDGSWSLVNTGFGGTADFTDLFGFASNDVWAVGGDRLGPGGAFIAHWDGQSWTQDASVPQGVGVLWSAWGASSGDVWAVSGNGEILRNQGGGWTTDTSFAATFRDVDGTGPNDVWAVGWDNDTGRTIRWDGNQWTSVDFPFGVVLYAVQALGPNDVYAAGGQGLYHFDGDAWSKIDHPQLQDPSGGFDLTFFDMRIAGGRLFAASTNGFLVISDGTPVDNVLDVTVEEPGGLGLASDVTVTLTDVNTGEFYIECTDANGVAQYEIPDGDYIVHARNLEICSNAFLRVWPEPSGTIFNTAATENENRVGVIHLNGQSETLTPSNYKAAVASPLTITGGTTLALTLRFEEGATLACSLVDGDGNTFTLSSDEHVFNILPFGDETGLPPVTNPGGLPRGIALSLATIQAGDQSDDCSVSGMPSGDYVYETDDVEVDGETRTFTEPYTVSDQDAQSGSTVTVEGTAEEPLSITNYILDPLGDARRSVDIGPVVTFGWGLDTDPPPDGAPGIQSDSIFVRAGFEGEGNLILDLRFFDPDTGDEETVNVLVSCDSSGCTEDRVTPRELADNVAVEGESDPAGGKVEWRFFLPGIDDIEVRVRTGPRGPQDRAPDRGFAGANKQSGGNSFMVKGD